MQAELDRHYKHNFIVNVLDTTFFGMGLGFASFVTVIPLFVAMLTDNTAIIGLIASVRLIGWQLPQVLTSDLVAGMRRYKWAVVLFSGNERIPFFLLAGVALAVPTLGRDLALILTFALLIWQGLGGGFTATAWQTMVAKIIPARRRGFFYGVQSSAGNLMMSGGVVVAGWILAHLPSPQDFALCFFLAALALMASWVFVGSTREPENPVPITPTQRNWRLFGRRLLGILRKDGNFRWFLVARLLAQFAYVAVAFFTIYGVRRFGMDEQTAGILASVLALATTLSSPLCGWLGDRLGHRRVYALGILLAAISALCALAATGVGWLYPAFFLAGVVNTILWTTTISITSDFGTHEERPYYIGLSNTAAAPGTLFAPIIGGWLADAFSFEATFLLALVASVLAFSVMQFIVRDPRPLRLPPAVAAVPASASMD